VAIVDADWIFTPPTYIEIGQLTCSQPFFKQSLRAFDQSKEMLARISQTDLKVLSETFFRFQALGVEDQASRSDSRTCWAVSGASVFGYF